MTKYRIEKITDEFETVYNIQWRDRVFFTNFWRYKYVGFSSLEYAKDYINNELELERKISIPPTKEYINYP